MTSVLQAFLDHPPDQGFLILSFRAAVEAAGGFDELPAWAQDWIRKAEQGPLQVRLRPPA